MNLKDILDQAKLLIYINKKLHTTITLATAFLRLVPDETLQECIKVPAWHKGGTLYVEDNMNS